MIVRVALKIRNNILIGEKNKRHDSLYTDEILKWIMSQEVKGVKGFITNDGEFLDRTESARHAFKCGQIKKLSDTLISEDLW